MAAGVLHTVRNLLDYCNSKRVSAPAVGVRTYARKERPPGAWAMLRWHRSAGYPGARSGRIGLVLVSAVRKQHTTL